MVIQNHLSAASTGRQIATVNREKEKTTEKLSSGYSVNRSADNAAGLRISEGMRRMVRGLDRGTANIEDGVSLIQVADGALNEVENILHRMNELAVQSANGTNSDSDRAAIQDEVSRLAAEVDRIGETTKFNEKMLFDYPSKSVEAEFRKGIQEDYIEEIPLVTSDAAKGGYLTDALQIDTKFGTMWHPSASLDFSNLTAENIRFLDGTGFTFYCSAACNEAFQFVFQTDGTPSSVLGQNNGQNLHVYTVDISECGSGAEVADAVYEYVKANMPNHYPVTGGQMDGALKVSHSNEMVKTADGNGLTVYAVSGCATPEAARAMFANTTLKYGSIDATALLSASQEIKVKGVPGYEGGYNEIRIQGSGNSEDGRYIRVYRMDAEILGVHRLELDTEEGAGEAIGVISKALARVSSHRSSLGADQNRLEHAALNNRSAMENVQASESRIRDADMAEEFVSFSSQNILAQVGVSMLTQANQTHRGTLALLS